MRCLLVCPSSVGYPPVVHARVPAVLLPLVDRPFLQHVVERLAGLGVTELELLLAEHPEAVERLLGDGSRWGLRAHVHLLRDPADPYTRLSLACAPEADQGVLLVHGDRLPGPCFAAEQLLNAPAPVLVRHVDGDTARWSGWAWLPPGIAGALPTGLDEAALEAHLASLPGATTLDVARLLDVTSMSSLLAANRTVLEGEFPGLLLAGREVEPGVWLSRNVVLHPRARVVAPVHLGENVRVGAGTQVGPHAVVGHDSILDERCRVESAVVAPGSYVGEALDLVGVLVDRNLLVSAEHGVATTVTDRFILGSMTARPIVGWGTALTHRLLALLALALTLPLLLAALIGRAFSRRASVWFSLDALRQPAEPDEATWRTHRLRSLAPFDVQASRASCADLVLRVLPLLPAVVTGRLGLVGVPPRSPAAVRDLAPDWRDLVLRARAGVIWESHAIGARSDDERRAAESYYVVMPSLRHDLAVLAGYLRRVVADGARHAGRRGPT